MDLAHRITATALAAAVTLGTVAPVAAAKPVPQQPYSETELNLLLRAVTQTGHAILSEDSGPGAAEACTEGGMLGAANTSKQLLLCVRSHKGDNDELADTARHEVVHLVQFAKGRCHGATAALINPNMAAENLAFAQEVLRMPMDRYAASQHYLEAEARTLAQVMDESQIAELLRQATSCQL